MSQQPPISHQTHFIFPDYFPETVQHGTPSSDFSTQSLDAEDFNSLATLLNSQSFQSPDEAQLPAQSTTIGTSILCAQATVVISHTLCYRGPSAANLHQPNTADSSCSSSSESGTNLGRSSGASSAGGAKVFSHDDRFASSQHTSTTVCESS
jgi:hypothetical protein